jgi:hypothetical protein
VICKAHEGTSLAVTESSSSVSFWNADADNWDSEDEVIPSVDQENGNFVMQRPHKPREYSIISLYYNYYYFTSLLLIVYLV